MARVLGVIPARGGSKGIPDKNIKVINGKPLLVYTIEQSRAVPELDLVVVSTDSEVIKETAIKNNARVIDRPADLASDTASTETALIHALEVLEQSDERHFDYIVVLEPTSPLRRPETISRCINTLIEKNGNSLLTVAKTTDSIGKINGDVFIPLVPGAPRRRQDREPFYAESSTVYVCRTDYLRETKSLVSDNWVVQVVSNEEAVDINDMTDFILAEILLKAREEKK